MLKTKQVENAKPNELRQYKLSDSNGLYLLVKPNGSRLWRWKYFIGGAEKCLSLGKYPAVSLAEARRERNKLVEIRDRGIDPSAMRKAAKAPCAPCKSFSDVWTEYIDVKCGGFAEATMDKHRSIFGNHIIPFIGASKITAIQAPDILTLARRIEGKGKNETAHRAVQLISQIFQYAIDCNYCASDPAGRTHRALKPVQVTHHPAIVSSPQLHDLLVALYQYSGTAETLAALKLSALFFVRPGELRRMEWSEVDLDAGRWIIPAEKMKSRRPHDVPLCHQAVEILRELHALTGHRRYVFPCQGDPDGCMSENTVSKALRTMGFDRHVMSAHGFRATACTILNEAGWHSDAIEIQLAHVERNKVRAAYLRADFMDERIRMMQWWGDQLDALRQDRNHRPTKYVHVQQQPTDIGRAHVWPLNSIAFSDAEKSKNVQDSAELVSTNMRRTEAFHGATESASAQ